MSHKLLITLQPLPPISRRPRKVTQGQGEKAIIRVDNFSQGIIPRSQSSHQPEYASSPLNNDDISNTSIMLEVGNPKEQEVHVQGEEEEELGDARL